MKDIRLTKPNLVKMRPKNYQPKRGKNKQDWPTISKDADASVPDAHLLLSYSIQPSSPVDDS
ncbi:hypothetical protein ACHAPQ_010769, partial [Fusarium lateritium]